ncbi:MAG: phosphonoacetaldehyde reductase [Clostridia bacterium]|nr:phosphonoacetaldehyde reductase [Clostridia bacterium]
MKRQNIQLGAGCLSSLDNMVKQYGLKQPLLVCDASFDLPEVKSNFSAVTAGMTRYSDISPNPRYEDILAGVKVYKDFHCDGILTVGGGSVMDTAKCIKLFSVMPENADYLTQIPHDATAPLIAVPTTAGTGSESTRYAVIYHNGEKQTVTHPSIIPDCVFLDALTLRALPAYQKKSALLDALCQGIESMWAVGSTQESTAYARDAVASIMRHADAYLNRPFQIECAQAILEASNLAGLAINVTQTTAAHAMCYKLTTLFGLAHGHAVAVVLPELWRYMLCHIHDCIDIRGEAYLKGVFTDIAFHMGCQSASDAIMRLEHLLAEQDMRAPRLTEDQVDSLTQAVNPDRLKNTPVTLGAQAIAGIYAIIGGARS